MKSETKETLVIINFDWAENRVAVLEDGVLQDFDLEREARIVGNIYKGVVKNVLSGMDAAFVDIGEKRNAFLYVGDVVPAAVGISGSDNKESFDSIADAVQIGDEVLVQVVRAGSVGKGARVSTRISLPGRYVVLLAQGADHVAVSQRISSEAERDRLRRIGERLRPLDFGLFMRTEAAGNSPEGIGKDLNRLLKLWEALLHRFQQASSPSLLYQNPGFPSRVLMDIAPPETARIIVDSPEAYQRLKTLSKTLRPELQESIELYEGKSPIFEAYNVEPQLRTAFEPVVELRSGGYLVIDETEAFTMVDVNTGHFTGTSSIADTVLYVNQEAAEEIARQLRLRDIGGVIIVDFIDMMRAKDRVKVMNTLEHALKRDRSQTKIVSLSPLGLVELTRQRRGESLVRMVTQPCPHCGARGRVKSALTVSLELRRHIQSVAARTLDLGCLVVMAHPDVAAWLVGEDDDAMIALEQRTGSPVFLFVDPNLHEERFSVSPIPTGSTPPIHPDLNVGDKLTVDLAQDGYPIGEPLFVVAGNQLIRLPSSEVPLPRKLSLRVNSLNRWYAESEFIAHARPHTTDPEMMAT